jgi:hypothetical protein
LTLARAPTLFLVFAKLLPFFAVFNLSPPTVLKFIVIRCTQHKTYHHHHFKMQIQ